MLSERARRRSGLVLTTLLLAACGGKNKGTGGTASTGVTSTGTDMSTTSTMSSMSTGSTTSTGSKMTSSGTGGAPPSACTQHLLDTCKLLKMCAPHVYMATYENDDALCQSEAVRLCATLPTALDNTNPGVVDPAGCATATSGATCDAFLATLDAHHIPAACEPNPGKLAVDQPCNDDSQCGAGLTCFKDGPDGCKQYCGPVGKQGRECGTANGPDDQLCDPRSGLFCVRAGPISPLVCNPFMFGKLGDGCINNTATTCDSGLYCDSQSSKCAQRLSENATCTVDATSKIDPCDARLGLSCQPKDPMNPNNGSVCQPLTYVPDGAMCDGTKLLCGAYSYCQMGTSICKRKAMLNEGCVVGGCFPPYACTAGTCQAPPITPDPTCTADPKPPATTKTCGVSNGGIPFECNSGLICCVQTPKGSQDGYTDHQCITNTGIVTCGSSTQDGTEMDCNDSAQCSAQTCCWNNGFFGNNASCQSTCASNLEICRLGNAAACGGQGCLPHPSSWDSTLPPDTGFCKLPTCSAPGELCTAAMASQCCSGKCSSTTGTGVCN